MPRPAAMGSKGMGARPVLHLVLSFPTQAMQSISQVNRLAQLDLVQLCGLFTKDRKSTET